MHNMLNLITSDAVTLCCVSVCLATTPQFVKGNICSSDLVTYVLREEEIDTIMHFAAQTHVDNSFGNSFTFTHNNIMGTHVLLESAKELGTIRRFIHVSTDEVYGEGEVSSIWFDNSFRLSEDFWCSRNTRVS